MWNYEHYHIHIKKSASIMSMSHIFKDFWHAMSCHDMISHCQRLPNMGGGVPHLSNKAIKLIKAGGYQTTHVEERGFPL